MSLNRIIVFGLLICFLFSFSTQDDLTLTIHISGGHPNEGQAIISLFSTADNYLNEPVLSKTLPMNEAGEAVFELHQLKKGIYAVSVIYDQDNNGELNTGFLGIPKELVGFSNNAKGNFGPPSFTKASFEVSKSEKIEIVLGKAKE